uniref:Uncharacterized protein n=1 Tax=Magallana gigas TaxID=29159 RepID=A0A8W8MP83_MAGGI
MIGNAYYQDDLKNDHLHKDFRKYLKAKADVEKYSSRHVINIVDNFSSRRNSQEHCVRSVLVQKTKMSTRKLVSVSVTRNGVTTKIPCTQEVADMLMSKEIDSKVKEIIVNELMLSPSTPPSTGETSIICSMMSSIELVTTSMTLDSNFIHKLSRSSLFGYSVSGPAE